MLDTLDHLSEPQKEKPPTDLSAVPAQKAQNAIRKAFPCAGDLKVRHLWSTYGISRFRATWFCEVEGKTMIVKSLFLCLTRAVDGLVVRDETVVR